MSKDEIIEIIHCQLCSKPTSFERERNSDPPEGEHCSRCGKWICIDCVDWEFMADKKSERIYCLNCGRELS